MNAAETKISVVVPFYNAGNCLDRCLQSLTNQRFRNLEIILINDGSTDSSAVIASQWVKKDSRIQLLKQQQSGVGAARATGVNAAIGEFIGFVDSDDLVDPQMYVSLVEAAEKNMAEVVQCGFSMLKEDSVEIYDDRKILSRHVALTKIEQSARTTLLHSRPTVWRRVYRADFLKKNEITFNPSLKYYDDLAFQFEVMMKVERFIALAPQYYSYFLNVPNQITSYDDARVFEHFALYRYLWGRVGNEPKYVTDVLLRVEFDSHVWALKMLKRNLRNKYRMQIAREYLGRGSFSDSLKILKWILIWYPGRGRDTLKIIWWWIFYLRHLLSRIPVQTEI